MGLIDQGLGGLWAIAFYPLAFVLVLTPVVFIHELGHFLVARWCGVKVKDFSIGLGKEVFGFYDRYGTRWRFSRLPLGGFVKFMDDDNASSFPSRENLERLTPAEREGAFQTKSLAQRAAIVAAGPVANFLLSIAIFTLMFTFIGELVTPPRVGAVTPDGPAATAGFKPNDLIVSIDDKQVRSFADLQRVIAFSTPNQPLAFTVDRAGSIVKLTATPVSRAIADPTGHKSNQPTIGIEPPAMPAKVGGLVAGDPAAQAGFKTGDLIVAIGGTPVKSFTDMQKIVSASPGRALVFDIDRDGSRLQITATPAEHEAKDKAGAKVKQGVIGIKGVPEGVYRVYGPVEALGQAVDHTYAIVADSLTALYKIATRSMSPDQLRGPLGIAEMAGQVATWGPIALINLVAVISVAIGFFNLLPVPVLDGGHLVFYAIEAVRRQPLSERTQEISFRIGLALVLLLFVFVTVIDVRRWVG
jgi:regulator of sigma E protease